MMFDPTSEFLPKIENVPTEDARILVVDDEEVLRGVIAQLLRRQGHEVTEASFGEDALAEFIRNPYQIVITDIIMGNMDGIDLLREIKKIEPDCHVIVMTSNASMETAILALREGAYDYLIKPFDELELILAVVDRALSSFKLRRQNKNLTETLMKYSEELERMNKMLKGMAERDGLTDLYNHRHFRESLDRELIRAHREKKPVSLIIIDLDFFKTYNDTNGHLAGDKLLKDCSQILKDAVRGSDLVARYGGEEFVLLLPNAGREDAVNLAERIREQIADHPFEGRECQPGGRLTASMGVSTFPEDSRDASTLIDAADKALYQAKESGRNTVTSA